MKFNTKYKYDKVTGFHFNKASLTDQSQSYDANINNIVNNMGIVQQQATPPQFGQTFNPGMYEDALNVVATAKSEFEKLPSQVRREFNNDPSKFIDFYDKAPQDELLAKKAVKLGIYRPEIMDLFKKPTSEVEKTSEVTSDSSK